LRILRGDMHRHTDLSFDGDIDGSIWDFYRYSIDAADFDYAAVPSLSAEVRQKLGARRPATLAQASRMEGMTPAALLLLLAHLREPSRRPVFP